MNKTEPLANQTNELMVGFLHDLNNLYTCAIASLGLARSNDADQPIKEEMVEVASKTIFRATELTSLMMTVFGGQELPKEKIDLRGVIRETVTLASQTIKAKIEADIDMPRECCNVNANSISIMNVIINLLLNADRAVDGCGTIYIRCSADNNGEVLCDDKRTPMVSISVINPRHREPAIPEGVLRSSNILKSLRPHGIGLKIVSTIVEQHGGNLTFSQEDLWTTAEVSLPMI